MHPFVAVELRPPHRAVWHEAQKPVDAICHAPWILIEAGVLYPRELTSYHTLQTDLQNVGASWLDEDVAVDAGFVTSRSPADLGAFKRKMVEEIWEGEHAVQSA